VADVGGGMSGGFTANPTLRQLAQAVDGHGAMR